MLDIEIWLGLLILTTLLYGIKWWHERARQVTVYRISPESLKRSKQVIMDVLPLVEDGESFPLDSVSLRHSKDDVKSAAKILTYYFWKKKQHDELVRIKSCFVAISRFQDRNHDMETQERRASRERKQLERELAFYMTHTPFNAKKKR
jgi:hypothetical protein